MTKAAAKPATVQTAGIAIGIAAAIVAAVAFVVLTVATGTTYHLFPLLIGFAPGGLPRVISEQAISARDRTVATAAGLAVVGAVWLALVLLDEMPHATLIAGQPGGVGGEFVLFGAVGAIAGAWWGSRPA